MKTTRHIQLIEKVNGRIVKSSQYDLDELIDKVGFNEYGFGFLKKLFWRRPWHLCLAVTKGYFNQLIDMDTAGKSKRKK